MKNTYILLALLPLLSAGNIFGAQVVNVEINTVIQNAFQAIRNQGDQEILDINLERIVPLLIEYAKPNNTQEASAITQLTHIKAALIQAINTHYDRSLWSNTKWLFNIDPNKTVRDLKDNLEYVEDALAAINAQKWRKFNKDASKMLSTVGKYTLCAVVTTAIVAPIVYLNKDKIGKSLESIKNCMPFIGKTVTHETFKAATEGSATVIKKTVQSSTQTVAEALAAAGIAVVGNGIDAASNIAASTPSSIAQNAAIGIAKAPENVGILAAIYAHKIKIGVVALGATAAANHERVCNMCRNLYNWVKENQ